MKKEIFYGLLIALFLAILISPVASPWPDGLEKVAADTGFIERGDVEPLVRSPLPDYSWPGINSGYMAVSLAGMAGTIFVFCAAFAIGCLLKEK